MNNVKNQLIMGYRIEKYNQYNLKVGSKYSICPICSKHRKKKTQKCMMLDWETGLGTCIHCGITIQLHSYTNDKNVSSINESLINISPKHKALNTSYIKYELLNKSLTNYKTNNFIQFLVKKFGYYRVLKVTNKYYLGTSKHWKGANIFWQVDINNKIRSGKVMLYDKEIGKRVKTPYNHITWVHKILKLKNFNLKQCFFGEHLLKEHKPIAIVESEKTAIIASLYLPRFTWLAVGSLTNLNVEKCKVIKDKTVILYPDINAYDIWRKKAEEINKQLKINFIFSDLLEKKANDKERKQGLDLADFLIKYNLNKFTSNSKEILNLNKMISSNQDIIYLINKLNLDIK